MNNAIQTLVDHWPSLAVGIFVAGFFTIFLREYRHVISVQNKHNEKLEKKVTALETKCDVLNTKYDVIDTKYNDLKLEHQDLKEKHNTWVKNSRALAKQYSNVVEQNDNLSETNNILIRKINGVLLTIVELIDDFAQKKPFDSNALKSIHERLEARGIDFNKIKSAVDERKSKEAST